jgi:cyclopropane fatty-acyl-phospholipid synthase-like methyltransferase
VAGVAAHVDPDSGAASEWWRAYFEAPLWQAVQLGWDSLEGESSEEQADRIVEALRLDPGTRVLDAPCGAARIAIELAARGMHTAGLDITDAFLDEGRRRAAARGVDVEMVRGDLRDAGAVPPGAFDAVVCIWGSFGYFDESGNRAQARAAATALRPGGLYLLDMPSMETLYRRFRERNWFEVGEVTVLQETELSIGTGRAETTWTFIRGAERETRRSSIRVYSLHELTNLLRSVGFASFEARDGDLEPFELDSHRLWLVATRGDD